MDWNRILSSLLALIYVIRAYETAGAEAVFKVIVLVIFPLACIWYGEAMGGYVGFRWGGSITNTSPGILVCVLGWVLLIIPLVLIWF
jgi:hypothetical protein